jgi:hypothetical protein
MAQWVERLNNAVAHSFIGKHFQLEGSGHRKERKHTRFTTELRAGLTIFFAMVSVPESCWMYFNAYIGLYYLCKCFYYL